MKTKRNRPGGPLEPLGGATPPPEGECLNQPPGGSPEAPLRLEEGSERAPRKRGRRMRRRGEDPMLGVPQEIRRKVRRKVKTALREGLKKYRTRERHRKEKARKRELRARKPRLTKFPVPPGLTYHALVLLGLKYLAIDRSDFETLPKYYKLLFIENGLSRGKKNASYKGVRCLHADRVLTSVCGWHARKYVPGKILEAFNKPVKERKLNLYLLYARWERLFGMVPVLEDNEVACEEKARTK